MGLRRFLVVAASVGAVVGVALTWPLVLHLGRDVLEDGTLDGFQFVWNLWWTRESLLTLHTDPFFTYYLFYPEGIPLVFHTGSFALGVLSLPIQLVAGPVTAHNVVVVTAPALTMVAIALLAREATGDDWAALVAGLLGTITPYMIWVLPVIYLSCGWIPPALLWLWWVIQRRRSWALVAAALALLAFSVFASQEYAMMAMALLGLDVLLRVARARRLGLPPLWLPGTAVFLAVAGAFFGGLARVAARSPAQAPAAAQSQIGSGYLVGFLAPPWLVESPFVFARTYYLGTVTLVLGVIGLSLALRRAAYWTVAAAPLVLMVMGPYLHLFHPRLSETQPRGEVPGLYLAVGELVPLLRFLRAPYRWMAAANPVMAVLAGVGAAALRARMGRPAVEGAVTAALLALAVALPAIDYHVLRAPLMRASVPPAYDVVIRDPEEAALIDLPSGFTGGGWALLSSRYMFYQTAHRKFLLDGTVSRLPPGRQFFLARKIDDFATLPYVKYLVVHRDLLAQAGEAPRRQTEALAALAERQGRLVAQDATTDVYRLDTFRPDAVRVPETR